MDEHDRDEQHVAIITPTEIFSLQGSNLLGSLLAEQKRKKKNLRVVNQPFPAVITREAGERRKQKKKS